MNKMAEQLNIFFFGDSICFGQGIAIHKGWVPRISAKLSETARETGTEIVVVNASINGNTTRQALERMPYDVQSHHPDVLIVQFGMNDCNYWETDRGNPRVSPGGFKANLHEIVARAMTFGAKKVYFNTNHPTTRTDEKMNYTTHTYQQSNEIYNQHIREVTEELGNRVSLNDIEAQFKKVADNAETLQELLQPDKLHLSEKGHDVYYDYIYPRIEIGIKEILQREEA
jgi:acyl-CoA thioesterase I